MSQAIDIRPLTDLNLDEILPVVSGYESGEKYAVEKREDTDHIVFDIRLVPLDRPHTNRFEQDFTGEDLARYSGMLAGGFSFGAYLGERMVGLAICEVNDWNGSLRIWEFHVTQSERRSGVGRALMQHVLDCATRAGFRVVTLETQNTNVPAIRFYRRMGFTLEGLDLSLYTNHDVEAGEVAFTMKKRLS